MHTMLVLHSKRAFFNAIEGVTSKNCSLAPLACLNRLFCINDAPQLIAFATYKILRVLGGT